MRLLPHPDLVWREDGTPEAPAFGDIYFTSGDGLAESRAVFFAGCGLPEAWVARRTFTVAETGFGTGLNFLGLWQMWRAHRPSPGAVLHFVSFEAFPLKHADAARALAAYPELAPLIEKLLAGWPEPVRGTRQTVWPEEGITLTLHLGDIAETLPGAKFSADAWFLDGFSPARNPDMWTPALFQHIAAHSAPGARAATFTVSGAVRRGLEAAGFAAEKKSGHGRKRERLEAHLPGDPPPQSQRPHVAILGAGIAGATAARALMDLGARVTVFDPAPLSGASANPLALVMPRLDAGDTVDARLMIDAYLAAQDFCRGRPGVIETDVIHRPRDDAEAKRFAKLRADPPLPDTRLSFTGAGLVHHRALMIRPGVLIPALFEGAEMRSVALAPDLDARTIGGDAFDAIVLANGMSLQSALPSLTLTPRLGQVDFIETQNHFAPAAIASGPYALRDGATQFWGATFEALMTQTPETSDTARAANRAALETLAPGWAASIVENKIQSRASVRATTQDRLPLIGALPSNTPPPDETVPGVYVSGGHGSRGFTFAPFAARLIAADILGAPRPTGTDLAAAASPMRFVHRARKKAL